MSKWQDFLKETPSPDYADRVMRAAEAELAKNKSASGIFARPAFRWSALGGLAAIAAALIFIQQIDTRPHGAEFEMMSHDGEMLKQIDFFNELDTLEAWDEIEASDNPPGDT